MRTPAILLVLLLIGHTHGISVKPQSQATQKPHLGLTLDPGFVVKVAKLGDATLKECLKVEDTDKSCYVQDKPKSKVNFVLIDVKAEDTVDFEGGTKTLTVKNSVQNADEIALNGNKVAQEKYTLEFIPTKINLKRTAKSAPSVVASAEASTTCEKTSTTNCLSVVSVEAPVKVFVASETATNPQVVTLQDGAGKEVKATFFLGSAAASMTRSVAIILANLVIVFLVQ